MPSFENQVHFLKPISQEKFSMSFSLYHRSLAKGRLLKTRTQIPESQASVLSTIPHHFPFICKIPESTFFFAMHQILKKRLLTENNVFVIVGKIFCEHRNLNPTLKKYRFHFALNIMQLGMVRWCLESKLEGRMFIK